MNIKSNKIVLAVIAYYPLSLLTCMTNGNIIMWKRCQASDMADSEAYAFVNHHSSLDFMLEGKVELAQCNSVRATSTKCWMKREMVHQMSSDILGYMSHHRSRYS